MKKIFLALIFFCTPQLMAGGASPFPLFLIGFSYNCYKFFCTHNKQENNKDIRNRFRPIKDGLNGIIDDENPLEKAPATEWAKKLSRLEEHHPYIRKDTDYNDFKSAFNSYKLLSRSNHEKARDKQLVIQAVTTANEKANFFMQKKLSKFNDRKKSLYYRGALTGVFGAATLISFVSIFDRRY